MRIIDATEEEATVTISSSDLAFLQSAINETLEALDDKQLRIRTAATREQAQILIEEIKTSEKQYTIINR